MNIALVIERIDPSRGGRETSTAQIASCLARRGHKVTIICQRGQWNAEGVEIRRLGRRGLLRFSRMANFLSDVGRAVAGGQYDIVHAMLPVAGADVYQPRGGTIPGQIEASRRLWGLAGAVRVGVFERLNFCRSVMGASERKLFADESVTCLAVSRMIADEFRNFYGRQRNVRVVYNGVDVPAARDDERADWRQRLRFGLGVGSGDPVFVTVATNLALKGISQAITAFARWYHSHNGRIDGRLVVIGHERPEGYERLAGLRDVGRSVVFVPPTEEVFRWYSAADACVLLSWYDPCSRVVLEATRWGLPSITTAYNGAAEAIADGAGIVVDSPNDIAAVAAAMDAMADGARRAAMAEQCCRTGERLSVDRHVDELLAVYKEVRKRK